MSSQDPQLAELVATAETAIAAAERVAASDRRRPVFHFRSPGQWMDDPNGIICHEGLYHVMYSLNPHSSEHRAGMVYKTAVRVWDPESEDWTGGITVWGHARSRDLLHWEHLPIALYPQVGRGEHFIWFGCTAVSGLGVPTAIYTAIGPQLRPEDSAQQWGAIGSADLVAWEPLPEPLLTDAIHGEQTLREWRDPFVFADGDRTFMVLGAQEVTVDGPVPAVALYEATSPALDAWRYRGVVFRRPGCGVPSAECPNLFRLGDRWVLLVSPHGPVEWYVGDLDVKECRFVATASGLVDHSTHYYATNVMRDGEAEPILWAAIEGFTGTAGWNGALSLPRRIGVRDGELWQRPSAEVERLRGQAARADTEVRAGSSAALGTVRDGTADVEVEVGQDPAGGFAVRLSGADGDVTVAIEGTRCTVGGHGVDLRRRLARTALRIVVDRTVVEVYVDETDCYTHILAGPLDDVTVTVTASGFPAHVTAAVWQLDADGLFSVSPELAAVRAGAAR